MASTELGQIQDFLLVFRRRKWQVIVPALFVLAGGIVFAVIVPKKYVVDTRVELIQPPLATGDSEDSAAMREIANATYHIMNTNRVRETIVAGNWAEFAGMDEDERHDFVISVRDDLKVDVLTQPRKDEPSSVFVDVEYKDTDGARAEKFLAALTKSWIDEVVQRDKNQLVAQREEWQNQVVAALRHYEETTNQYTNLLAEMGISASQPGERDRGEEDPIFTELGIARQSRDAVSAELEELRAKIEALRVEHEALDPEVPDEEVDPGVDLRKQIYAAEAQINKMRKQQEGRTPANSLYQKAQKEIESLEKEIELAEAMQREASKRIVYVPNPEREKVGRVLDELELEEKGLVAKLQTWSEEVDAKTALYHAQVGNWNALIRLRTAWDHASRELDDARAHLRSAENRLATYTAVQGEPYRIAEPPVAPPKPNEPNPYAIVIASLLGGFAVGLAVAFLAEFSHSCFRSVGDLSRTMGVPILGVVNAIYTRAEIRRRRSKRMVIGASTVMILASVAWFTYTYAFDPYQLPGWLARAVDDFRLSLR